MVSFMGLQTEFPIFVCDPGGGGGGGYSPHLMVGGGGGGVWPEKNIEG